MCQGISWSAQRKPYLCTRTEHYFCPVIITQASAELHDSEPGSRWRCPFSLPQGLDKPPLFIECVRLTRRAHSVGLRVNPSCVCVKSRFPGSLPCPRYPKKNNIFLMIYRIPIASFICTLDYFANSSQQSSLVAGPSRRPM